MEEKFMQPQIIFLICAVVLVVLSFVAWVCSRYKKCPSDKIMVIYGFCCIFFVNKV